MLWSGRRMRTDRVAIGRASRKVTLGESGASAFYGRYIPTSSWGSPALTSIALPLYELGATAARMILQMVQGLPTQEHVVFPFQIHMRASSVRG
jgi:DNA-binding LacI/PurR family transcriptional regulator